MQVSTAMNVGGTQEKQACNGKEGFAETWSDLVHAKEGRFLEGQHRARHAPS